MGFALNDIYIFRSSMRLGYLLEQRRRGVKSGGGGCECEKAGELCDVSVEKNVRVI